MLAVLHISFFIVSFKCTSLKDVFLLTELYGCKMSPFLRIISSFLSYRNLCKVLGNTKIIVSANVEVHVSVYLGGQVFPLCVFHFRYVLPLMIFNLF